MRNIYVCIFLLQNIYLSLGDTTKTDSSHTVTVVSTTTPSSNEDKEYKLEYAGENVVLHCTVDQPTESKMRWYKGEKEITDDDKKHYTMVDYSLEVLKAGPEDVGEYFCLIDIDGKTVNKTVVLYSPPQVKHFEPSTKNLVQGDPLVLECNMWGWPHPEISWEFNHTALNTNDSRVKISQNSHGVANAKLRLENVDYPDGGDYSCVGTNVYSTNSSSITVQIKNKYAALWPFLGICVEVAILCTIIFIYERRHAKKLAEEEEEQAKQEEAEHLASNNDKKEFDDIRHREVKA